MSEADAIGERREDVVDASLVLDTRSHEGALGLRDGSRLERRLLFRAPNAHIEVRIPPPVESTDGTAWLCGQYVATDGDRAIAGGAPPRVEVSFETSRGSRALTATDLGGEFVLPCRLDGPFWLEFRAEPGRVVRTRVND